MKRFNKFLIAVLAVAFTLGLTGPTTALATGPLTVDLKTAAPFAILAGTPNITNVPTSVITGNVGLSPATGAGIALTQAQVTGTIYAVDGAGPSGAVNDPALLTIAKNDLTAAYTDAAGRTPATIVPTELGGQHLYSGVYTTDSTALGLTAGAGPLVLDAQDDASAVFIFEGSDAEAGALTVGTGGTVSLINGASACNVFWRVYGAIIGTSAVFKGNILALTSITVAGGVGTESNIEGRLLARNANVTLDHTIVAIPDCTASNTAVAARVAAAAATTTQAATLVATKLPDTGVAPSQNSAPINIAILASVFALSTLFVVIRRKKRAI